MRPARLLVFLAVLLPLTGALAAEPLAFDRAVERAMVKARILELDRNALRQATLALEEAKRARGPELTLKAGAGYLSNPEVITVSAGQFLKIPNPSPPPTVIEVPAQDTTFPEDAPNSYFELTVSLGQPLYTWGKLRNAVQIAALDVGIHRSELAAGRRQLRKDLHQAYFSALVAEQSIEVLEQIESLLAEIHGDRERLFELGLVNRLSLLEIESRQASARARLVNSREARRSALEAVSLYTGLDPGQIELTSWFREIDPALDEDALRSTAEEVSPRLSRLALERQKADANLALTRGASAGRPDLSLQLGFEVRGQGIPRRAEIEESRAALRLAEEAAENAGQAFDQQLITRERWAFVRSEALQMRLEYLSSLFAFEMSLAALEAVTGFHWPGVQSLPIN